MSNFVNLSKIKSDFWSFLLRDNNFFIISYRIKIS